MMGKHTDLQAAIGVLVVVVVLFIVHQTSKDRPSAREPDPPEPPQAPQPSQSETPPVEPRPERSPEEHPVVRVLVAANLLLMVLAPLSIVGLAAGWLIGVRSIWFPCSMVLAYAVVHRAIIAPILLGAFGPRIGSR